MKNRVIERPDWDDYFMEMAEVARKRSTCLRRAVGAIIVKDHRILTTGIQWRARGDRALWCSGMSERSDECAFRRAS